MILYVEALAEQMRARALSQGFEPGHDPYNSASSIRAVDFEQIGQMRADFYADEAFISACVDLPDEFIRRAVADLKAIDFRPGPSAVKQARYSAIALEEDRDVSVPA